MPDFIHKPVMVSEALAALRLRPGARVVDGTTGGGSHAAAILAATAPDGWLFGCDQDSDAVTAARQRLGIRGTVRDSTGEFFGTGRVGRGGELRRDTARPRGEQPPDRHGGARVQFSAGWPARHAQRPPAIAHGGGVDRHGE